MTDYTPNDILNYSINQQPLRVGDAFDYIMRDKISAGLDAYRAEFEASVFNAQDDEEDFDQQDDDFEDEDIDLDSDDDDSEDDDEDIDLDDLEDLDLDLDSDEDDTDEDA
jgi:hypothetical protein